jgi:hypothetical protein
MCHDWLVRTFDDICWPQTRVSRSSRASDDVACRHREYAG